MKRASKKPKTRKSVSVVILSITFALIIILQLFASLLQKLGMPMSLALGLIPVLVISQTHGIKFGALSGMFFGLITLVFSVIYASAIPIYGVTVNPLVSVFPRIMVGVVCALSYNGIMKAICKKDLSIKKYRLSLLGTSTLSTVLGVLTNTILFLGMFFAFAHGKSYDGVVIDMKYILASIVALNTVIELVLFAVVTPSIVYAMTQSRLATKMHLPAQYFQGTDAQIKQDDKIDLNSEDIGDEDNSLINSDIVLGDLDKNLVDKDNIVDETDIEM